MRVFPLGLTAVASVGALLLRARVDLVEDSVDIGLPRDELLAIFKERFARSPEDILAMEPDRLVRRFSGSEGAFSFKTVEIVRYRSDGVTFEHLAGPFAECKERFRLDPIDGGTRLTHEGFFRLRGGMWTAPLAFGPVKKAFERHVHGHFETLASDYPLAPDEVANESIATM